MGQQDKGAACLCIQLVYSAILYSLAVFHLNSNYLYSYLPLLVLTSTLIYLCSNLPRFVLNQYKIRFTTLDPPMYRYIYRNYSYLPVLLFTSIRIFSFIPRYTYNSYLSLFVITSIRIFFSLIYLYSQYHS